MDVADLMLSGPLKPVISFTEDGNLTVGGNFAAWSTRPAWAIYPRDCIPETIQFTADIDTFQTRGGNIRERGCLVRFQSQDHFGSISDLLVHDWDVCPATFRGLDGRGVTGYGFLGKHYRRMEWFFPVGPVDPPPGTFSVRVPNLDLFRAGLLHSPLMEPSFCGFVTDWPTGRGHSGEGLSFIVGPSPDLRALFHCERAAARFALMETVRRL